MMLMLTRLAAATPEPVPTIMVQLTGEDPTLTIVGLVVSALAAIVGGIAAVASMLAARAARKATDSGDEAARHAATAADAAQQSAAYQRAAFESDREDRLARQARAIYVIPEIVDTGVQGQYRVRVGVKNTSSAPITDVSIWAIHNKVRVTGGFGWAHIAGDAGATKSLSLTTDHSEKVGTGHLQGVVTFTDENGLRWERRTGTSPVGIDRQSD